MVLLTKDQYQTISKANSYLMDAMAVFDGATCITTNSGCYSDVYNVYTSLIEAFNKLSALTHDSDVLLYAMRDTAAVRDKLSKAYHSGSTHAVIPRVFPDKVECKDESSTLTPCLKHELYNLPQ